MPIKTILILENSVAFTGAFKAALQQAKILQPDYRFIFCIPSKSTTASILKSYGFKYYQLPLVEISRSPKNLLLYFPALFSNFFRLKKIIRQEQCYIVQVNDFYNLLGSLLNLLGYKVKLITYVRFLPSSIPSTLRKLWVKTAQRYSSRVIAVSDSVLMQLPQHKQTVRIYDPVAFEEKYDKEIRSKNEIVQFLYLANYTKGKGQEDAINAFALAYKEIKNIRLNIYGGDMGLGKNRQFRADLEADVTSMALDDVIIFHDFVSDTEKVIKKSDVLLNFSKAESFSMTVAEASYYGIPVIATRSGGPEEIIEHEKTGLLVEIGNVEAMKDAIINMALSKELRERLGHNARLYVRTKFNQEDFLVNFRNLLNEI